MKVVIGSLALLLVVADGRTRIPRSLSKAALEATKRTPKLRKLEQKRVRGLTEMIKKEGKLTLAKSPRLSEKVRPERKSRALKVDEQKQITEGSTTVEAQEGRELENNYNYNYNNGNNQNANNNAQQADGAEDAEGGDNVWQYNWNYEGDYELDSNMDNEAFGFDMTAMSFHYTGCSAIKTWNDEMAQDADTDTVLMAQRMATFRLCPTASCSSNTYNGCSSNYGDYVVSMDQFLLGMLTMQEDRVMGYCEYCQDCADIESFKSFYSELEYRREYLVQSSTKSYESWAENYKANYANANANNANGNYYNYNANGEEQEQAAADDDKGDDYYQQLYYKKLTSGNYANNYVYGGNGAYQNYQNNYNGNGYQYNNQQQNYENYANNYNNNGQNNNGYYYNGNNGNQAYGGNYGENQGQYGYQSSSSYGGDGSEEALTDDEIRANTYQETNSAKWQMWDSFNMNMYGQQNGGDYQMYQQMSQQMQAWSGMGAWNGHRVVNGRMTYDNGVATWEAGWGFIGSDGEFYSLEDTKEAITGTDWGYELPQNWEQWLDKGDQIESCSYDNAGSCYNQFFACMQVLGDDTYSEYVEQFNEQLYEEMFEDAARERFMASMTDYLECTKIDFDVDWNGGNNNNNQNQENQDQQNGGDYQGGYANGQWQAYEGMDYQGQWEQYRQDDGDLEFYIGPHCDGDKITLGVYTDEYCSTYASGIAIEDLLGFNPMDDADEDFTMVPTECVSCAYDEAMEKWYEDEEVEGAEDGIEPMCSILYQFAGKCQKNLKPATSYSNNYQYNQNGNQMDEGWLQMYQSENQYLNEELVCAYIDSLRLNTYDEQGEVNLDPSISWKPSEWQKELRINRQAMSGGYKAGLVITSLAMAAMAIAACVLHGMLARKNIPWRAKKLASVGDQTDLARQNSGILMGRSRSGAGTTPLI